MNELATLEKTPLSALAFSPEQVKLIRDTVAKDTTPDEFAIFLYACRHTGLNPLLKQIHAVKRWDSKLEREAMAIQVGIDGFRLIAARTKRYAPGKEPSFLSDEKGKIVAATAYVQMQTEDGTWHEVAATAYYDEYVQTKKDGSPNAMWAKMPRSQLAKCAETLAIRKAFPNDTSGIRGDEEMEQADSAPAPGKEPIKPATIKKDETPFSFVFTPAEVSDKSGGGADEPKNNGKKTGDKDYVKPWIKWGVKHGGEWYSTFVEEYGALLLQARDGKFALRLTWKPDGKFRAITNLERA